MSDWLQLVLVTELSRFRDGWKDDGDLVVGPGTLAVRVALLHDVGPGHVDLGFVLNRTMPAAPVIWDCVAGGSTHDDAAARLAAGSWAQTTAAAIWEMLTQTSQYADHSEGSDALGLAGWHSVHSPHLGLGVDNALELRTWCVDHPVVPALRHVLGPALQRGPDPVTVHGVKFLLVAHGDDSLAEVRIDGERHEACSAALFALPWPRTGIQRVRFFVLFLHTEH